MTHPHSPTVPATGPNAPVPASQAAAPRPTASPSATQTPAIERQFVSFACYHLDPAFRRQAESDRAAARDEFAGLFAEAHPGLIELTYSTVGLKAGADFLIWRIGSTPEQFQVRQAAINKSRLGAYLSTPTVFTSMTKRSMYIDQLDPFHTAESRTHIIPGKAKYLFVYPFVKTRDWYLLPLEKRQELMNVHIRVGNAYPSVKLNTTYSFGLDDQDFVVAFESNEPKDFLDLVMALRETESSKYTQRDTPIFTCVQMPMGQILGQLF